MLLQQRFDLTVADAIALVDDPDPHLLWSYIAFGDEKRRKAIMDKQGRASAEFLEQTKKRGV